MKEDKQTSSKGSSGQKISKFRFEKEYTDAIEKPLKTQQALNQIINNDQEEV